MEKDILIEYAIKFGKFPPLIMELPYESEHYENLMAQAIENNEEITDETISKYIKKENIKYGVVEEKNEENDMNEEKIRKLLAQYGAEESEIENFINDLNETKEELEEDVADEDYVLDQNTINKLKETQDGINLLIKAPEMAKEELKKAIADYLQK